MDTTIWATLTVTVTDANQLTYTTAPVTLEMKNHMDRYPP